MGNRYLVLSDLHLTDIEEHPDGWKAYKSRSFVFDAELGKLVKRVLDGAASGDPLTLVLNGDIFDFDLITALPAAPPWPLRRRERLAGLDPTPARSAWKLERILADHPVFLDTLVDVLARGHRIVYVLGNHDRELHFPEVRRALLRQLEERGRQSGRSISAGGLTIEPWFFYVPGEIYVEHGQQYDYYTSFRYLLWPQVDVGGEPALALPLGNLSNRVLMNRMGYFNPHASDFILNFFRYAGHWLQRYAFSRRSLVVPWLLGSLGVIRSLLSVKRRLRQRPPEDAAALERVARRFDLPAETLRELGHLQQLPIAHRLYRVIREFWIDRLLIALLMTGGTVALALVPIPLWIKLMVPLSAFPLLYFVYEWLAQGETIFSHVTVIPENARAIARLLPVRLVSFGHTHVPRLIPLAEGVTFVDTGCWAPATLQSHPARLRPGLRNYLLASFHLGEVQIELGSWMADQRAAQAPAEASASRKAAS
jgi:UDP-2,3-diacylglucosamine pyrophosphatase LpxH